MVDTVEYARGLVAIALALLVMVAVIDSAMSAELPQGYTCEQVKAYVKEHGKLRALIDAKLAGATREQIMRAKECLRTGG